MSRPRWSSSLRTIAPRPRLHTAEVFPGDAVGLHDLAHKIGRTLSRPRGRYLVIHRRSFLCENLADQVPAAANSKRWRI